MNSKEMMKELNNHGYFFNRKLTKEEIKDNYEDMISDLGIVELIEKGMSENYALAIPCTEEAIKASEEIVLKAKIYDIEVKNKDIIDIAEETLKKASLAYDPYIDYIDNFKQYTDAEDRNKRILETINELQKLKHIIVSARENETNNNENKEESEMKKEVIEATVNKEKENKKEGMDMKDLEISTKDELRDMLVALGIKISNNVFKKTKKAELIDMVVRAEASNRADEENIIPAVEVPVATEEEAQKAVNTMNASAYSVCVGGDRIADLQKDYKMNLYQLTISQLKGTEISPLMNDMWKRIDIAYKAGYREFVNDGSQGVAMLFWYVCDLYRKTKGANDMKIKVMAPFAEQQKMWTNYGVASMCGRPAVVEYLNKGRNVTRILVFEGDTYRIINVKKNMIHNTKFNTMVPVFSALDFTNKPQLTAKQIAFVKNGFVSVFSGYMYNQLMKNENTEEVVMESSGNSTFHEARIRNMKHMVIGTNGSLVYSMGAKSGVVYQHQSFATTGVRKYGKGLCVVDVNALAIAQ